MILYSFVTARTRDHIYPLVSNSTVSDVEPVESLSKEPKEFNGGGVVRGELLCYWLANDRRAGPQIKFLSPDYGAVNSREVISDRATRNFPTDCSIVRARV